MGCSDAPARPAKLGLYMLVRNPDASVTEVAGRSCPTSSGVEWDIGKSLRSGGKVTGVDSPRPNDFGTTVEDGKSGVKIECTVRKNGVFTATGEGTDPIITPPDGLIKFTLSGTAKEKGTPVTNQGELFLYTPKTFDVRTSTGFPACTITAVHEQAPGALWADFDCPALTKPTEPARACHASGTIVLEYCKTGEEDD
jgi:hypothetical protein